MMRVFRVLAGVIVGVILWNSCSDDDASRDEFTITLRWSKAYAAETRADVMTGLEWNLSFLGAELPSTFEMIWVGNDRLVLDISKAGFSDNALNAWRELISVIKESEEYSRHDGVDIGRFI